jgi:hypothetical protein
MTTNKLQLRYARVLSLLIVSLFSATAAFAQITPLGDAFTNSADPTTNYGAATLLEVDGTTATTYIQFNLASIPSGATVSQATLKLYVNAVTTAGSFNVDYVNGSWAESTIDHSNAPALGTTIASNVDVTTADKNQYILVNVTTAVQAWLSGSETNDGIALVANSTFNATFDSKENTTTSHPAELDIAYAGGDGTITGVTTASGSGLTGGGTSGTLNLSLTTACSSGQVLSWNGSAWACSNAGTGTITGVTAGTYLTGGGTSGNVTLNLNTGSLNASYAQLSVANTFTANNIFEPFAADAIDAYSDWPGKTALVGLQSATSGGSYGVWAATYDPAGAGVSGINYSTSLSPAGSYGGYGVYGVGLLGAVAAVALNPASGSGLNGGNGIFASGGNGDPSNSTNGGNGIYGVGGIGGGSYGIGGDGIYGVGGNVATGSDAAGGNGIYAIGGGGDGNGGVFVAGCCDSLDGTPVGGDGIDAYSEGDIGSDTGPSFAGWFDGTLVVNGTLFANAKDFKIDHPLDPANKYLVHASVESSEMMNIYTGNVTTDAQGTATVQLPEWFEALNTDFRYQLTVIGQFAQAIVARKIQNHEFTIKTNAPNVEVSWQITGVRQDAYAKAHPLVVEEEKEARLKGFYLQPELYGAPAEKQIEWARHPQMMKRMQQQRQSMRENQAQPVPTAALLHRSPK